MDLEDLTSDYEETADILNSVGTLYIDNNTRSLTLVGYDVTEVTPYEFKKIYTYYTRYRDLCKQGSQCKGCNERMKGFVLDQFNDFVRKLKIKYFGGV